MSSRLAPFLALGCLLLMLSTSSRGQGLLPHASSYSPDDEYWANDFGFPGIDGSVSVLFTAENGDLYAGGSFRTAGVARANNVAYWDGLSWHALGSGEDNGVDGGVRAFAEDASGDIYVGGSFSLAGGVPVNNIARWDGLTWSAVGTGLDGPVHALEMDESGTLYAGGDFETAGGVTVNHIAKWDGASWTPIGSGFTPSKIMRQKEALFVAGDTENLMPGDAAAIDFLEEMGFTVEVVSAAESAPWMASDKNAVLISESCSADDVGTKFTNTPAGVVTWEPFLYDDFQIATARGSTTGTQSNTTLAVGAENHPLNSTLFAYDGSPTSAALYTEPVLMAWGAPVVSAEVAMTIPGESSHAGLFAVREGALLADGSTAAGRRVAFPAFGNAMAGFTDAGRAVFEAAVVFATSEYDALLVSGQDNPYDVRLRRILEDLGYAVGIADDDLVVDADAEGSDLVYISESVVSGAVEDNFHDFTGGVVNSEGYALDGMMWTGPVENVDYGITTGQVQHIVIELPEHPMAARQTGTVQMLSTPNTMSWGSPGPEAQVIAHWEGAPDQQAIFGYDQGATMVGATAAGRRVFVSLSDNAPTLLTADGQSLVEAAVLWAAGRPAGYGTSDAVHALAFDASENLYVGGEFALAGDVTASSVARWDGLRWSALEEGLGYFSGPGTVAALAVDARGLLCAAGKFSRAGGQGSNGLAYWDGSTWYAIPTIPSTPESRLFLTALAADGSGKVFVSGATDWASRSPYLAQWDGSALVELSRPGGTGDGCGIAALTLGQGDNLYAGGSCFEIDGGLAPGIARWDDSAWSDVGGEHTDGLYQIDYMGMIDAANIFDLALNSTGELYARGNFTAAGTEKFGEIVYGIGGLAGWDGTGWQTVGDLVLDGLYWGSVGAMALGPDGMLSVGWSEGLAQWNGSSWRSIDITGATGYQEGIRTLAVDGSGHLYVGGSFTTIGGIEAHHVARWDGVSWSALGGEPTFGLDGNVYELVFDPSGNLYAGGDFTAAGTVSAHHVAKWNGSGWEALGDGVDEAVRALAVDIEGNLYAGGDFTMAGGNPASHVAKWNGAAWSALGTAGSNGVDGDVYALAMSGTGDLYVGGDFTQAGGVNASHLAKWNVSGWSGLGSGLDGTVTALTVGTNTLWVGGRFTRAGDKVSYSIAEWTKGPICSIDDTACILLPIDEISLEAFVHHSEVALSWEVDPESEVAGFEVQHRPATGENGGTPRFGSWRALAYVEDQRGNAGSHRYTHTVADLEPGAHQFRIREIDLDGAERYSEVIEVQVGLQGPYTLSGPYPNPASDRATIRLAVSAPQTVALTIYDPLGRTVRTTSRDMQANQTLLERLDLTDLAAGFYLLRIAGSTFHVEKTLIVR